MIQQLSPAQRLTRIYAAAGVRDRMDNQLWVPHRSNFENEILEQLRQAEVCAARPNRKATRRAMVAACIIMLSVLWPFLKFHPAPAAMANGACKCVVKP